MSKSNTSTVRVWSDSSSAPPISSNIHTNASANAFGKVNDNTGRITPNQRPRIRVVSAERETSSSSGSSPSNQNDTESQVAVPLTIRRGVASSQLHHMMLPPSSSSSSSSTYQGARRNLQDSLKASPPLSLLPSSPMMRLVYHDGRGLYFPSTSNHHHPYPHHYPQYYHQQYSHLFSKNRDKNVTTTPNINETATSASNNNISASLNALSRNRLLWHMQQYPHPSHYHHHQQHYYNDPHLQQHHHPSMVQPITTPVRTNGVSFHKNTTKSLLPSRKRNAHEMMTFMNIPSKPTSTKSTTNTRPKSSLSKSTASSLTSIPRTSKSPVSIQTTRKTATSKPSQYVPSCTSTTSSYSSSSSSSLWWDPIMFKIRYEESDPRRCVNPLFLRAGTKRPIYYDDDWDFDPDDGTRSSMFLNPAIEKSTHHWLAQRKQTWRKRWNVHNSPYFINTQPVETDEEGGGSDDESARTVTKEFWQTRGFPTFWHWLLHSKSQWRRTWSWNETKRRKLEEEQSVVVAFPSCSSVECGWMSRQEQFRAWLRVRKKQWMIMLRRRQRKRKLEEEEKQQQQQEDQQELQQQQEIQLPNGSRRTSVVKRNGSKKSRKSHGSLSLHPSPTTCISINDTTSSIATASSSNTNHPNINSTPQYSNLFLTQSPSIAYIDAIIEDEERQKQELERRPPLDIMFLFDANLGIPDDVACHCLSFLDPSEHWKLLSINRRTATAIKQREPMWQALCPKRWILPRRPRKPWHALYLLKIREEKEAQRKLSDDVLNRAHGILSRGDQVGKIAKLIRGAEASCGFRVDYSSGVVQERNSVLNLAVIEGRHRCAKWLIESCGADIETSDRGNFTPLLNAAWRGDRYMVRFLLGRGADRSVLGTGHCSKALAHPDFEGLTAEGWARKRGHDEVADLIRLGLA